MKLVLSSEHGGNAIPKKFRHVFKGSEPVLETHRGYDLGSLDLFNGLKPLADFSHANSISRLLIECNRSLWHAKLFSEFSLKLSKEEQKELVDSVYHPYRNTILSQIESLQARNETVFHLSVHSFTPQLNGSVRKADIAFLYDPKRPLEKALCKLLKEEIKRINPKLTIRFNYPYTGISDGFTTHLRKKFPVNYAGIELEVNQKYAPKNKMDKHVKEVLFKALSETLKPSSC